MKYLELLHVLVMTSVDFERTWIAQSKEVFQKNHFNFLRPETQCFKLLGIVAYLKNTLLETIDQIATSVLIIIY